MYGVPILEKLMAGQWSARRSLKRNLSSACSAVSCAARSDLAGYAPTRAAGYSPPHPPHPHNSPILHTGGREVLCGGREG